METAFEHWCSTHFVHFNISYNYYNRIKSKKNECHGKNEAGSYLANGRGLINQKTIYVLPDGMVGWFRSQPPSFPESTAGLGDRLETEWFSEHCFGDGMFRRLPRTTKDTVTPNQTIILRTRSPTFSSSSVQRHMSWPFAVDENVRIKSVSRPLSAPLDKQNPSGPRTQISSVRSSSTDALPGLMLVNSIHLPVNMALITDNRLL